MELKQAIEERRSVRKYTTEKVNKEIISRCLDEACWAPSAVNRQPWSFLVVQSDENLMRLKTIMSLASRRLSQKLDKRFPKHPDVAQDAKTFIATLGGASTGILVFMDKDYEDQNTDMIQSIAAAIQNFCLLAHEEGLATCWLSATAKVEDKLQEAFGKGKGACVALITVGYQNQEVTPPKRHTNKYEFI